MYFSVLSLFSFATPEVFLSLELHLIIERSTSKRFNARKLSKTISKHEKTISLADHLVPIADASKALSDGYVWDAELNSISNDVEQYYSLKAELRERSAGGEEKIDVEALREKIWKQYQKKLGSLLALVKS